MIDLIKMFDKLDLCTHGAMLIELWLLFGVEEPCALCCTPLPVILK